jgi:hypothetical protein
LIAELEAALVLVLLPEQPANAATTIGAPADAAARHLRSFLSL